MAWETQGAIADRTTERLGYSDRGIVIVRDLIKEQIEIVQRGGDPIGRVWDPEKNGCIELEAMTSQRDLTGGARPRGAELPRTRTHSEVFDARHQVFEVPYGAARPRIGVR